MNPEAYFQRIGYTGTPQPNYETLKALHRAHLLTITYENLDIHLGRYLPLDEAAMYEKIVVQRRGGWCYEMNGLFAWALRQIGFQVTLLASAVNRQINGANAERNHLILRVDLDQPYLADVGFGNGFLEPLPLAAGRYARGFLTYRLEQDNHHWYFHNHVYGGAGFDFSLEAFTLPDFAAACHFLQTSPESGFVRTTVCHRFLPEGIRTLKGAVLRSVTPDDVSETIIDNFAAYQQALTHLFDLHLPDADVQTLWESVWERHQAWVALEKQRLYRIES